MLIQMSKKDYDDFINSAMKSADKSHKAIVHLQSENDLLKYIINEQNKQLSQMHEELTKLRTQLWAYRKE